MAASARLDSRGGGEAFDPVGSATGRRRERSDPALAHQPRFLCHLRPRATTRYVQNVCIPGPDGTDLPYAGLGELFETLEDAHAALTTAEWQAVIDAKPCRATGSCSTSATISSPTESSSSG